MRKGFEVNGDYRLDGQFRTCVYSYQQRSDGKQGTGKGSGLWRRMQL